MSTVRFTLEDEDGAVTFGTEKVQNWRDIEATLVRSKSYRGIVRKLTNSFSFVHDVKQRLYRNYDINGTNGIAIFSIEVGNDNREEFSYSMLGSGFPMKADFSTLARKDLTAEINFVDSDFANKIKAGEKEKINFTTLVGLNGDPVTDYNTRLKSIYMHDRQLLLNSELSNTQFVDFKSGSELYMCPSLDVVYKSSDDVKSVVGFVESNLSNILVENYVILRSQEKINTSIESSGIMAVSGLNQDGRDSAYFSAIIVDSNYNEKYRVEYAATDWVITNIGGFPYIYVNLNYSFNIDLEIDDSILMCLVIKNETTGTNIFLTSDDDDFKLNISGTSLYPATTSNCILPHEYFTQMIEVMTGHKNAFYSTYFGRTDILDSKGNQIYTEDGEGAYLSLHDGHMIRNLPIDENPFNSKFKDVLEDFIKLKNLVAQIEYRGDIEVFRIEKYGYIFASQSEVLDFGDTIAEVEINESKELTYGSVKVGYEKVELENLNGLDVVHGELNYSTPLIIDNELDLVMKWIAESYAIEQTRREQFSVNPKGDTKYDKDIFPIEAKINPDGTTDLIAKRAEDYELVTGILSPDNAYNLGITPAKILREWGSVVNGCLLKNQSGKLILTKSASNNELSTKKPDKIAVSEGANIDITDLDSPLMLNQEIAIGDLPMRKTQWDIVEENSNGIFKILHEGRDFYFRINLAINKISEMKGSFKGVKANM